MANEFLERCARAGLDVFLEAFPNTLTPSDARYIAKQMARAVLKAGRLSECPDAVVAAVAERYGCCESEVEQSECDEMREVFRAAEDVVLAKEKNDAGDSVPNG